MIRTRRAFSLVEMLIVISIIAIVLVVEGRIYQDTMKAIQTSSDAEDRINSLARMSSMLRNDVWGAASAELPDSRSIVLSRPDGVTVRWQLSDTDVIRTTEAPGQTPELKWNVSLPLHARRQGATVVLYTGPVQDGAAAEMRFISQTMLARGNQ